MKHIQRILFAVMGFSIAAGTALNAQSQSPYSFLRLDAGARAAALSGAFVAIAEDPHGLFYNPAAVITVRPGSMGVSFQKHVLDINSGVVSYSNDLSGVDNDGHYAVAVSYLNYGSFDEADQQGNLTGSFGGFDLAASGTYSNWLDSNFSYGVTLKFIANSLENESSAAVAVDAGLLYSIPESRVNIGVAVLHAGTQLSQLGGASESLPLDVRIGVNHRLRGLPLLLNVSLHHLADDTEDFADKLQNFAIGGELYLSNTLHVRLGYDNARRKNLSPDTRKGLSGFSGGLGILLDDMTFHYGASSYGMTGVLHRFSVDFTI